MLGIDEYIQLLYEKSEYSLALMHDFITLCTDLLAWMDSQDCIQQYIVMCPSENGEVIDYDNTINCVKKHALYSRLVAILDRLCSCCYSTQMRTEFLLQLLQWMLSVSTNGSPEIVTDDLRWCWIFAFLGNNYVTLLLQFLLEQAITSEQNVFLKEKTTLLPLLQYFSQKYPLEVATLVNRIIGSLPDLSSIFSGKTSWRNVLLRLGTVSLEAPGILAAIDGQMEWILSAEDIRAMYIKLMTMPTSKNDSSLLAFEDSLSSQLLRICQSSHLRRSSVQLLDLFDKLINQHDVELSQCVAALHTRLADECCKSESLCLTKKSFSLLSNLRPSISLLCEKMMDSRHRYVSGDSVWQLWLGALGKSSRKLAFEILVQLTRLEILHAGFETRSTFAPLIIPEMIQRTQESDQKEYLILRWELICWSDFIERLAWQCSQQYHTFLVYLLTTLRTTSTPGKLRRMFSLIRMSLNHRSPFVELPLSSDAIREHDNQDFIIPPNLQILWTHSDDWLDCCGRMFWEKALDFACSHEREVVTISLELLRELPIPSFQNPTRRYCGIYRLFTAFKRQLGWLNIDNKDLGLRQRTLRQISLIQTYQMRIFQIENITKGISSSAFTAYVDLWINHVFSASSTCCFPSFYKDDEAVDMSNVDYERTISSKCTSYPVSRPVAAVMQDEDASIKELLVAQRCAMVALHTLQSNICNGVFGLSKFRLESDVTKLIDTLLERFLPCCGIPSDDIYKEILPNRSHFNVDVRMEQWLHHCPISLPLIRLIVATSRKLDLGLPRKLLPLLKSALVVLIGYWNSVKGTTEPVQREIPPYLQPYYQLHLTYQLVEIFRWTEWFPASMMQQTQYLLPLLNSLDVRSILLSFWTFLANHPPSDLKACGSTSSDLSKTTWVTSDPFAAPLESHSDRRTTDLDQSIYLVPIRRALNGNIQKIRKKYALFYCIDSPLDKNADEFKVLYERF